MIDLMMQRLPRSLPFHAFNAGVVLVFVLLVAAPILSRFGERSEDIAESMAQLAHVQAIKGSEKILMAKAAHLGDPFLPGNEERLVSADLQANLKAIAAKAGVKFLGIRGLPAARFQQLRMVAASLEIEGPLPGVEQVIRSIEGQTPYLFVISAVLRRATDAEEVIRAELKVQGAIRGAMSPPRAPSHAAESDGE